jgi:histidinol-phosphate aminotransferase
MAGSLLSRRQFTALGAGLSVGLLKPHDARAVSGDDPKMALLTPAADPLIHLNFNESPYGPSPRAMAAMTRTPLSAARYADDREPELIAELARLHRVSAESIVLGCGSTEILKIAAEAFLGSGKHVIAAQPTFEAIFDFAGITRARALTVPLTTDHRHDLERMARICAGRSGIVYICNPNNPTGTIVTRAELERFVARVPRSMMVVIDEAYHDFVEDPRYASSDALVASAPNVVVVRTFSKIHGLAGMRLGYAVSSPATAAVLQRHRLPTNINAAVLDAGLASLQDPAYADAQRRRFNDTKRWLCEQLQRDGRRYIPSETNFVMTDTGSDVGPLVDAFKARGMLVGRRFPSMPTWQRVSIGTPEQIGAFVSLLRELAPVRQAATAA